MSRYSSSNPFATTHCDSDSDSLSCIVTDLFESRSSSSPDLSPHCSCNDININPFSDIICDLHDPLDEEHVLELGLRFVDEIESLNNDNYDAVFDLGDSGGLTVARFGSDSDSGGEEGEFEAQRNDDDEDDDDIDVHLCWDSFCLEDHRSINEWEDVLEERLNEIDEVEVEVEVEIDRQSESGASGFEDPDPDPGEEAFRYPEWEILLAVNNLERNVELEYEEEENIADLYLAINDGFISTTEYDVLFGQLLENESAMKGSPPAAKSFVENLPLVELTEEEMRGKDVACAICKDDIMLEEKVRRLPCSHCYHGDCIMPWLNMRNTCPVCRFELPTDDADYEESKIHRVARGLLQLATTHM